MAVPMVTGGTGSQNILQNLRIPEMSWKVISKKRKKKRDKKGKKNV
jgi:hypothetical protein